MTLKVMVLACGRRGIARAVLRVTVVVLTAPIKSEMIGIMSR